MARIFINGERTIRTPSVVVLLGERVGKYKRRQSRGDTEGIAQTGFDPWSLGTLWFRQEGNVNKLTFSEDELNCWILS